MANSSPVSLIFFPPFYTTIHVCTIQTVVDVYRAPSYESLFDQIKRAQFRIIAGDKNITFTAAEHGDPLLFSEIHFPDPLYDRHSQSKTKYMDTR